MIRGLSPFSPVLQYFSQTVFFKCIFNAPGKLQQCKTVFSIILVTCPFSDSASKEMNKQLEEQNVSVLCRANTENCLFLLLKLPFIYLKAAIVLPFRFHLTEVQLFRGMSEECQIKLILIPSAFSNKYTFLKPDNYCCISLVFSQWDHTFPEVSKIGCPIPAQMSSSLQTASRRAEELPNVLQMITWAINCNKGLPFLQHNNIVNTQISF